MTLACEDANSKHVDAVADVNAEKCFYDSLVQIWKFGFVKIIKLKFRQDFEGRSVFCY